MSGAQGWNVKGIDPKVREAAREAAARQGMSLGEYLNYALANHGGGQGGQPPLPRPRTTRLTTSVLDDMGDEWGAPAPAPPRVSDPARLTQRLESIERRTQLAVTGLDRAVSTIDRSLLGLAARIEEAEAVSSESAERVAEALEHFRVAGETLGGRLERADADFTDARERLENQVAVAEEVARRAEAAAAFLANEIEQRDATSARTLVEARSVAETAARQAAEASADAVAELRELQEGLSARLSDAESSTRRAVETAIAEVRTEFVQETRGTREALLEEVVRLEGEIAKRVGAAEQIRSEQAALIARIERAEAGARESTAGLRQAAGAAIADLRNAQLTLAARVKQVEDLGAGAGDFTDLRHAQQDIGERLAQLEKKTDADPFKDALAAFEQRLAGVETKSASQQRVEEVDNAVKTLDGAFQRLASRIAETETTANTAIRTLEETVSSLSARVDEKGSAAEETEALRALLEQRLSQMVGDARADFEGRLNQALQGDDGVEGALADLTGRLAAAERRHAQTTEAISLEVRRMSEAIDKRLRAVEARNDDAAAAAVREELTRMATSLEKRFDEIEHREANAFDRMGLEVGRLSERLEERVGAVETRSAQAIEQVGEQVARMAERFHQRQEGLARELGERMLDSEERAGARVSDAISSIMQRLAEVEQQSAEAIAPVQKAVSSVASKLDRFETEREGADSDRIPTPTRRVEDLADFRADDPPYVSPMDAAQPMRAGPLPPARAHDAGISDDDLDIYFEDDAENEPEPPPVAPSHFSPDLDDDLLVDDVPEAFADDDQTPGQDLWPDAEGAAPTAPENFEGFGEPEDDALPEPFELPKPQASLEPIETMDLPPPPPGKYDYLASARKAAQAQALPKQKHEPGFAPKLSLRGPSRIVVWGATTALVALAATGAWYFNNRTAQHAASPGATPANAAEPRHADPSAAADPMQQIPEAALQTGEDAAEPVVVAGPLAPRTASLEQAAQTGDLTAQYELALQRLAAGETDQGVTLLRRAADRGFAMAQYRLAKLYERGEGVAADLTVARQWTERAAAAGNRRAMHDLGVYFARGEGAPLDEAAAFRWFRQAAELGVADSQYNLGVLYQQGRGVNASAPEALFWFMVAARQGDADASARATTLESQLPASQVEQARARAQAFRPRAASAMANGEFAPRTYAPNGA